VIILDTNVLSALMRASLADIPVIDWLDLQPSASVWVTSVTVFESRFGLASLPRGKKRNQLEESFEIVLKHDLGNRILPFDTAAAEAAAMLAVSRQKAGRPVDIRDTQIAGIAISRRATIATRNVKHFDGLPVPVINPFAAT
jgi:toxin FitB